MKETNNEVMEYFSLMLELLGIISNFPAVWRSHLLIHICPFMSESFL